MNRRDFLKELGKAGIVVSAAGAFSAVTFDSLFAAGAGPKVIKLAGSPRDMGRQYADQAGELIVSRLAKMKKEGTWMPRDVLEDSQIFLNAKAHAMLQEVEGMAGMLEESVLDVLALSAEVPGAGVRKKKGCSSFVIAREKSKDGKIWGGQNVDDSSSFEKYGVVIIRHPGIAPPSITWALAGGLGGIGFNMSGVMLTMNYMQTGAKRIHMAIFPEFVANGALRQKDVERARAMLCKTALTTPVSFILSDLKGKRYVIERTENAIRGMVHPQPYACHTNHFTDLLFREEDDHKSVFPNSRGRLRRMHVLLGGQKAIGLDNMKKMLADTKGKPNGICRQAEPKTIASILMCPEKQLMIATRGRPDMSKYHEITLPRRPKL